MFVQSGEILPVAISDLERQIQVHRDMSEAIVANSYNDHMMSEGSRAELEDEFDMARRRMDVLIAELSLRQAIAA